MGITNIRVIVCVERFEGRLVLVVVVLGLLSHGHSINDVAVVAELELKVE